MEDVLFEFPTEEAREEILSHYNAQKKIVKERMKRKALTLAIVFTAFICL